MEDRPFYKKSKYHYSSDDCPDNECPTDADLLLLRKNAVGERRAIAFYLNSASITSGPLSQLFLDTAQDEMLHFRNTMTLLAKYDPAQATAFDELNIDLPVPMPEFKRAQNANCMVDKQQAIELLTRAITDELEAINMYQESYALACHADVKALFCKNANDEKLHVAEFWKALMSCTKEATVMP